jgi:hypothetical protein
MGGLLVRYRYMGIRNGSFTRLFGGGGFKVLILLLNDPLKEESPG